MATDAVWGNVSPRTVRQNGIWQAGARVYGAPTNDTVELPRNVTVIYPNPSYGSLYVLMTDTEHAYDFIKIYDSHGRVIYADHLGFARINPITLPDNVVTGIYTVTLESSGLAPFSRRIVIIN